MTMVARLPLRVMRRLVREEGAPPPPGPTEAPPHPADAFIAHANIASSEKRWRDAAALYSEALQLTPERGDIHVQAGHMFKEADEHDRAEQHYLEALRLMPDDADLALQLGHFYKITGRLEPARRAYARALDLSPGWASAQGELDGLERSGWRGPDVATAPGQAVIRLEDLGPEGQADELKLVSLYGRLAPELTPQPLRGLLRYGEEAVVIRQFGIEQRTYWGYKPTARGIEAIRGYVLSSRPVRELQARVNGLLIHRGLLKGPYELEYEPDKDRIHKYVFNIWHDFSGFALGHYELELRAKVSGGEDQVLIQWFVVEDPLLESDHPGSDGVINLPPDAEGSLEAQIDARPSVVREAWRPNQLGEVKSILVARSDQLGDLVASIPGIVRLREIFPRARLVGLLGPANADLARSLQLFDDILVINHAESWHQRSRPLSLEQQIEIRDLCAPYRFDLAIDLSQSLMSRPTLLLTGARITFGFRDPGWHRLTSSYEDHLFDVKNRRENSAHSKRILSMVERLHTATHATGKVIRREDLPRSVLEAYGVREGERFAALHTGARIVWSRWAHYPQLASRLLTDTDLKVVYFTDDASFRNGLPADLAASDRLVILDKQLPFDVFDAFMSFCSVFVGNDSGPKHLASLRGAPVVSIHSSRINWSEWGQEQTGVIITRKVPCAGCTLYHDPEDCGKDYACMNIPFEDVYTAVRRYV